LSVLTDKPSYFNMFDDEMVDSEDELVAGENNYIEIDCLPIAKEIEIVAVPLVVAPEEEKKDDSDKRSSQYKPSPREDGENANGEDGGGNPDLSAKPAEEVKVAEVVAQPPIIDVEDDDAIFCRFCWDGTNTIENPLLSVCKCSGGVGFVHYICLKYWLKTKQSENRTFTSWTIYWRTFGCEIC
jgi:hypothetical protein